MHYSISLTELQTPVCTAVQAGVSSVSDLCLVPAPCTLSQGPDFVMNTDPSWQNTSFRTYQGHVLLDGSSQWFRANASDLPCGEAFTVSLCFFPITYSAHSDGLFSCYLTEEEDEEEGFRRKSRSQDHSNQGLMLLLEKGGKLTVHFGSHSFSSIRAHAKAGCWNVVTICYRGYAGWCDLYVNGILSSRKQFPRHTSLTFPTDKVYLGRRCDRRPFREELPFGCFYGYLDWLELSGEALSDAQIRALHASVETGVTDEAAFCFALPSYEDYKKDHNRPCYHLMPPGKWMNEPHGPMYYKGWYHIFYQGNPHAPIWDHLLWGHLRSRDMLHWEFCPPALIPEKEPAAPDGCWSGSSVIDREGKPRIYFTAGNDKGFPNQSVALAQPAVDEETLTYWFSHPEPVCVQQEGWMGEFRDPFVWLEEDTYYMLVGSGDAENGGGNCILFSSEDGISWDNHGFLVDYDFEENKELGHVWELPVLLPLRDENQKVVSHILLLCACQIEGEIVETYYFTGTWDAGSKTFTPDHKKAGLLDLGRGCFTGPSGFVTPDLRSIVFTIAQGKRPWFDEIHSLWAHNGGLPAELSMRGGKLSIAPLKETEGLRDQLICQDAAEVPSHKGDALCLTFTAAGDTASVLLHFGEQCKEVRYDRTAKRISVWNEKGEEIGRWRGPVDDVDLAGEAISFTCYLDRSLLEIWLNNRKSVTLRNYTEEERYFEVQGDIAEVNLWTMKSSYC